MSFAMAEEPFPSILIYETLGQGIKYKYETLKEMQTYLSFKTILLLLILAEQSHAQALLCDLRATLFPPDSPEAAILRGQVVRSKHIILQGPGRGWKENVADWLRARGF